MNQHNRDAVMFAFEAQDMNFTENEVGNSYQIFVAAATAVKPFSSNWNPVLRACQLDKIKLELSFRQLATHWTHSHSIMS